MNQNNFPEALAKHNDPIFKLLGFKMTNLKVMSESRAYSACTFEVNSSQIVFRSAKITPTKTGQFVTVWRRNEEGITQAYEYSDGFDCMIIYVESGSHSGIFILSKTTLLKHGIISDGIKPGKRGIRMYPSWDETTNNQAKKTQKWQLEYFIETSITIIDLEKFKNLLNEYSV